jgi:hypothetical protein
MGVTINYSYNGGPRNLERIRGNILSHRTIFIPHDSIEHNNYCTSEFWDNEIPFMLLYNGHLWQILVVNKVYGLENETACIRLLVPLFDHAMGDSLKILPPSCWSR